MPPPALSQRVSRLKPSATLAVTNRAKAMARQGVDVISFGLGEPDFDTPAPIRRAAAEALDAGQTHYMPTLGDPETRTVIAGKLEHENGIRGLTWEHIAISAGVKHSIYLACQCLFDQPGEPEPGEAILPVPAWVSYAPIVELAGGRVVEVETSAQSGFRMAPEQLRRAITPRSRLLILNSPSNPAGTMYTPDDLKAIAAVVAEASGLLILTDEIYEKIIYAGVPHFSIGSVPSVAERTITLNGMSKAFAMTGWRVGYAACPGDFGRSLIRAFDTLQGQMTNNITSFLYPAVRVALRQCAGEVEAMRQAFARRAALAYQRLGEVPGMPCPPPQGAYYLFPDISAFFGRRTPAGSAISSPLDFAEALLAEARVAVVPGEDFGGVGRRHIRISFACSEELIDKGMRRLADFAASLT